MKQLALYPRLAPPDKARVWLGVFGETQRRSLRWTLDGVPATPLALRRLDSVRPRAMRDADEPRAFAGIYEFAGLKADTTYEVVARYGRAQVRRRVRTLPADLPARGRGWFNVMLVSCYHHAEARRGVMERVLARIDKEMRPHMTLLMGDQVYLDLPTLRTFRNDEKWLARKFENDYVVNWRGPSGMAAALAAAPSVAMPDDHEYWNNFPHASPVIQNSLTQEGRTTWRAASRAVYEGFQLHRPGALGDAVELDVGPLSLYIADTRSLRNHAGGDDRIFTREGLADVLRWCGGLSRREQQGVFVTGQSMFSKPASWWSGTVADKELSNYADCEAVVRALADAGRDIVCVTGDVHWGRFVVSKDPHTGRCIYEVISSPSALVTTVGSDRARGAGNRFRGLFGRAKQWPRHCDAPKAPDYWHDQWLGSRYRSRTTETVKGDQVAVLSFCRAGQRVLARATWYPVHPSQDTPVRVPPFHLPQTPQR